MHHLMLVDDEENILKALKRVLSGNKDWSIEIFADPVAALQRATEKHFDLFISDYRMPVLDGIDFLTGVKEIHPDSMRLLVTGYTDLEALMGAINQAEIFRFLTKPWNDEYLLSTIKQALNFSDVMKENRRLADTLRQQQGEPDL